MNLPKTYQNFIDEKNLELQEFAESKMKADVLLTLQAFKKRFHNHKLQIGVGGMGGGLSFFILNKTGQRELSFFADELDTRGSFFRVSKKLEMLKTLDKNMETLRDNDVFIELGLLQLSDQDEIEKVQQ